LFISIKDPAPDRFLVSQTINFMEKLNLDAMEQLQGGTECGAEVAATVVSIWSLGAAAAATGVGAGFGVALALAGFGLSMYSTIACANAND
jgi:hypothetical protein